ncbi:MAG: ferrous iron transport protein B [Clostridia bacterium]|nr:ferrous iron transport protein B [Clostridia bacterium]
MKSSACVDGVIALAGNPNVGKSTLFNALTGLHQHTGNWAGKTVCQAEGICRFQDKQYRLVDLPGMYSLYTRSKEEVCAADFLENSDLLATVVVCDATCLERTLFLALQIAERTPRVVVCINLLDEARKKGIIIDTALLSKRLGLPVVGVCARKKQGFDRLFAAVQTQSAAERISCIAPRSAVIENALSRLTAIGYSRGAASRLLAEDTPTLTAAQAAVTYCTARGVTAAERADAEVTSIARAARALCAEAVTVGDDIRKNRDRRIDRVVLGKYTALPLMLLLFCLLFWITVSGANRPSQWLSTGLFALEAPIWDFLTDVGIPVSVANALVYGVFRVVAWVVSVMLPPMAIFFPLFTLLEDFGYLPRIALSLDGGFRRAGTCGKQALTMCMGCGCNAAGVTGCRIIDSPRERAIAVVTNAFIPCNGRYPLLIALSSMLFAGVAAWSGLQAAVTLTLLIVLCVALTLLVSRLLSHTLFRGLSSSFVLELPPYRTPQVGRVLVRSLLDRTLFVLGRAVAVAAPAGLLIWLAANISVGDSTLLLAAAEFLEPVGTFFGLDGVILLAFIFGFPANELVIPLMAMMYMSSGTLSEVGDTAILRGLFIQNGWTTLTVLNTIIFCLFHWPCSTTCITVWKETRSVKQTAVAVLLPTAVGLLLCLVNRLLFSLWGG